VVEKGLPDCIGQNTHPVLCGADRGFQRDRQAVTA